MDLDDKVCLCFHVTRRKLVNFVRLNRPVVASQLSGCASAGTGCGWCIPFLKQIHKQGVGLDAVTAAEYAELRTHYIREGGIVPPPGATPVNPG